MDICRSLDILPREFHAWKRQDPQLRLAWEASDKDCVHAFFDRAASITRRLETTEWGKEANAQVNALKTALDGYQKICAKLNPGKYADQKDKSAGLTVIFNTDLPMDPSAQPAQVLDGDFTVRVDPKKLGGPRG